MNYFMADGSVQKGPYGIHELISQGLKRDTLVWKEGMAQWQRADTVPELMALFGSAGYQAPNVAPPPPPPLQQPQIPPVNQYYQAPAQPGVNYSAPPPFDPSAVSSQKIAAGICGILLGGLGIHKFVLGMTGPGLVMLLVTLLTCGFGGIVMGVIGLIEGIIYLTKPDQQFYQLYMVEKKGWF